MDDKHSQSARLHIVTFPKQTPEPEHHECTGYTCIHPDCQADRDSRAAAGVRKRQPLPMKRAA